MQVLTLADQDIRNLGDLRSSLVEKEADSTSLLEIHDIAQDFFPSSIEFLPNDNSIQ